MANLKNVIYLSNEDYEILVSTGTVTIDGETLTYDENNVYITPETLASTTEDGLMSASDKVKLDGINVTNIVTSGSTDVVTSGAVHTAINDGLTNLVTGPSSATNNSIALFDGTTGKLIKSTSNITIDNNAVSILPVLSSTGSLGSSSKKWGFVNTQNITIYSNINPNSSSKGLVVPDTTGWTENRTIATLNDIPTIPTITVTQAMITGYGTGGAPYGNPWYRFNFGSNNSYLIDDKYDTIKLDITAIRTLLGLPTNYLFAHRNVTNSDQGITLYQFYIADSGFDYSHIQDPIDPSSPATTGPYVQISLIGDAALLYEPVSGAGFLTNRNINPTEIMSKLAELDTNKADKTNATTSAAGLMSSSDKTKLNSIASGAEVNVQSDWSVTDSSSDAYIKNKPTIDTAISTSSTNAVQNKAIPLYIASRGENLLTNGTALLQNNYNFSGLTFDASDTYYAGGCFKHTGSRLQTTTNEYMPVDVSQTYEVSYWARSTSSTSTLYDFLEMSDIDKQVISARHVMWISGSTTTLAQELKNGDTKVYLTSVAGFNKNLSQTYQKGLIFWNYKSAGGYSYGTETYSRNVYQNIWDDASSFDTTNNTINLKSAWSGGTYPAGTSVSQCNDGSTYTYITTGPAGTTNWFNRNGKMSGVGKNNESGKFREGTAFVKLGWLIDQNSESNVTWKLSTLSVAKYLNKGTVTSVRVQATSPVVSSTSTAQTSTLNTTISLANGYGDTKNPYGTKTANYVLAGPTSGGAATPSFRALVAADIPDAVKNLTETTYSALKTLRDNSQLVPGKFYRITDYTCTTTAVDTSSAGHVFDIIVRADSVNKLNEEASAALHSGDTYFSGCDLNAWKLWYSLDNDDERFYWADTTNGKGVIYRMIDEFNNDCPYDFKNILYSKIGNINVKDNNNNSIYTFHFCCDDGSLGEIGSFDATVKHLEDDGGEWSPCYNNKIEIGFPNILPYIMFRTSSDFDFGAFYSIRDNTFIEGCSSICLGDNSYGNYFRNSQGIYLIMSECCNNEFIGCTQIRQEDFGEYERLSNSRILYSTLLETYSFESVNIERCEDIHLYSDMEYSCISNCSYLGILNSSSSGELRHYYIGDCINGTSNNRKQLSLQSNLNYPIYIKSNDSVTLLV